MLLQLFKGKFYSCEDVSSLITIQNKSECLLNKGAWMNNEYNFDHLIRVSTYQVMVVVEDVFFISFLFYLSRHCWHFLYLQPEMAGYLSCILEWMLLALINRYAFEIYHTTSKYCICFVKCFVNYIFSSQREIIPSGTSCISLHFFFWPALLFSTCW